MQHRNQHNLLWNLFVATQPPLFDSLKVIETYRCLVYGTRFSFRKLWLPASTFKRTYVSIFALDEIPRFSKRVQRENSIPGETILTKTSRLHIFLVQNTQSRHFHVYYGPKGAYIASGKEKRGGKVQSSSRSEKDVKRKGN